MQIGVLLNHYEPHQVPHVVPYGFALSRLKPDWTVRILCSTPAEASFAAGIGERFPGHRARIERIRAPLWAEAIDPVARHFAFVRKRAVQQGNRGLFADFDALIVPELTSLALREDPRLAHLKLIFTGHGTGGGYQQNFGMFDTRVDEFDLVLLQGPQILEDLKARGRLKRAAHAVIGYPKFEIAGPQADQTRFFDDDRPLVLYNPTQSPKGTSWHRFGEAVMEYFAASDRYNLIFAPHVLLFRRALTRGARLPRRWRSGPGRLTDLGSRASIDMTYQLAADIYLGDHSSQVYEFINWPRPCVFLNAHGFDWRDDPGFVTWHFGPVIDDPAALGAALDDATGRFEERWRPFQERVRDRAFLQGDEPASARGARAIAEFLETGSLGAEWC